MYLLGAIPFIGGIFTLIGVVCWIMYWVKIAGFSKELATGESFRDEYDSGPQGDCDDRSDAGNDKPWRQG